MTPSTWWTTRTRSSSMPCPRERTGVYCHDLDAFRSVLEPHREPRPAWFRLMARTTLRGLERAAVVFHGTQAVRAELLAHGVVDPSRLVWAPPGVSPEYRTEPSRETPAPPSSRRSGARPYLLHVGSSIPRKRLDVLFAVFAALRARHPELRLVQQGGALTATQREQVARLGLGDALLQPPKLDRATLAGLYRGARAVLVPSEAEGFGLPVIEALACGAPVVASGLPVLREVGDAACLYCPVGDVEAWVDTLDALLSGRQLPPAREVRLERARRFTWQAHTRTVLDAYLGLADLTGELRKAGHSGNTVLVLAWCSLWVALGVRHRRKCRPPVELGSRGLRQKMSPPDNFGHVVHCRASACDAGPSPQ